MDSEGSFIYSDQIDPNEIGETGTFDKFISMENEKSGQYTLCIVASLNDKDIKEEIEFDYENLFIINKINEANSPEELQSIIDNDCEKIHLDLTVYDELTDELRLSVIEILLQQTTKFNNSEEFRQAFKEAVSVAVKNKELPKVKENLVQGTDFIVIDNYDGTPDKIEFKPEVFNEENLKIKLYPLKDENGGVEEANLDTPIILGNSIKNLDGTFSVPESEIGDLKAGKYKFLVTAEDLTGAESVKDVKHVITIELVKESLEEDARLAVEKAEESVWKVDYDKAKALVDALAESDIKQELTSRLEKVKEKIDNQEQQEELEEQAYLVVQKAELSKTIENYNAAKQIVDKLEEGEVKTRLLDRLEKVKQYIEASESDEEVGFKVISVYGSEGIAKLRIELVFKESGIAITDGLDAYNLNITSHEVVGIEREGRYFMVRLKQEDLFNRNTKVAQESVKMEITKKDTSNRIVPKDNLDKDYHLGGYYKFITPEELATSLDGCKLELKSPSCDKEGIVNVEISMQGSLQLRPQSIGETTVSVIVYDENENEITVSFKVIISKPAPKLQKENLQQDVDFVVTYGEDGQVQTISFKPGLFEETGYEVRLYQWDDKNGNNILNRDDELGDYIVLDNETIEDEDGNIILPDSDISGLDIKNYKYIVAVIDLSTGKESRISQDFGFTIKEKPDVPTEQEEKLAKEAVEKVEETKLQSDYEIALTLVEKLIDGEVKTELTDRLAEIEDIVKEFAKGNLMRITSVGYMYPTMMISVVGTNKYDVDSTRFDFSKFKIFKDKENQHILQGQYKKGKSSWELEEGEYCFEGNQLYLALDGNDLKEFSSFMSTGATVKLMLQKGWSIDSMGNEAGISYSNIENWG